MDLQFFSDHPIEINDIIIQKCLNIQQYKFKSTLKFP